jgi:hyperosmotically inducible protein
MFATRRTVILVTLLAIVSVGAIGVTPGDARTVGQVIDDTAITTAVKAKLTADKISNLTKIEVKTQDGIVTLNGTVDTPERQARAEQIAASVNGVRAIVNNIHVAGTTVGPAPVTSAPSSVDATGTVAQVDPVRGTITLQDGRVLTTTSQTVVWQPSTLQALRPGAQVIVRGAAAGGYQPTAAAAPEWRMGTVRSVDRANQLLVLTDGTVVRLGPSTNIHRGPDRLSFDQVVAGSEIVVRTVAVSEGVGSGGSAMPGPTATTPVLDASEVNVVWTPAAGLR